MKNITNHIYTVFLAGASLLVTACGHKEPPKDEVINAMSAVIPGQFSIKDAEVEFRPVGEVGGMAKLKMEIAPKEDLYVSAETDPKVFEASQLNRSSSNETDALQQKARHNDIAFPSDRFRNIQGAIARRNAFLELVNVGWIKLATKAGTPSTVYGTVQAAYEFKEWRFSNARLDQRVDVNGQPRSAFRSNVNIVGSKEADDLAKQISDATDNLNKTLDDASKWVTDSIANKEAQEKQSIADKEKQEKQSLADREGKLINATKPGTIYTGTYQTALQDRATWNGNIPQRNIVGPIQLKFTKSNPATKTVEAEVSLGGENHRVREFAGDLLLAKDSNSPDSIVMKSVSPIPDGQRDTGFFAKGAVTLTATIEASGSLRVEMDSRGRNEPLTLEREKK